jgi:hypothetical protein
MGVLNDQHIHWYLPEHGVIWFKVRHVWFRLLLATQHTPAELPMSRAGHIIIGRLEPIFHHHLQACSSLVQQGVIRDQYF